MRTDLKSDDRDKVTLGCWVICWNNQEKLIHCGQVNNKPTDTTPYWRAKTILRKGNLIEEDFFIAQANSPQVIAEFQVMIVEKEVAESPLAIALLLDVDPNELRRY